MPWTEGREEEVGGIKKAGPVALSSEPRALARSDGEAKAGWIMHTVWVALTICAVAVLALGFSHVLPVYAGFIGLAVASVGMLISMIVADRKIPNPVGMSWIAYVRSVMTAAFGRRS